MGWRWGLLAICSPSHSKVITLSISHFFTFSAGFLLVRSPTKAFHYFTLAKGSHKFHHEFNIKLHATDDDRKLMARYNARREASEMVEYDHSMLRLREAVHEAFVKKSRE